MSEILNEKLFARNNNNLKEIDNIFGEIIQIVQNDSSDKGKKRMGGIIHNTKPINSVKTRKQIDDKLKIVGKIIAKEFGFYYVSLHLENTIVGINAYTYNQDLLTNASRTDRLNSNITDKGIKYTNSPNVRIFLGEGLFSGYFEPREITGILLHEIGHQFFLNRNVFMFMIKYMQEFIMMFNPVGLVSVTFGESYLLMLNTLAKSMDDSKILSSMRLYLNNLNGYFKLLNIIPFFDLLPAIALVALDQKGKSKFGAFNIMGLLSNTANEKFADNFATSFGYGPELTKALEKMETYRTVKDVPILSIIEDFVYLPFKILGYLVDSHPNSVARCRAQINYVNSQIAQLPNGPMKEAYKKDVKEMEKTLDTMADNIIMKDAKSGKIFSTMFNLLSLKLFKGFSLQTLVPTPGNGSTKKDWQQFM